MQSDDGILLIDAVRSLASELELRVLDELSDYAHRSPVTILGGLRSKHEIGHSQWLERLAPFSERLLALLQQGAVHASGFRVPFDPATGAEKIAPSSWQHATPDWAGSHVWFGKVRLNDVRVYGLQAYLDRAAENGLQQDVIVSDEKEAPFGFSNESSHLVLDGETLQLGRKQAFVVQKLVAAWMSNAPWVHGKRLMSADTSSRSVRDLFAAKRWKTRFNKLIMSDRKGQYRLNLPLESRHVTQDLATNIDTV